MKVADRQIKRQLKRQIEEKRRKKELRSIAARKMEKEEADMSSSGETCRGRRQEGLSPGPCLPHTVAT
jgi:hypothetical protein